MQRCKMEKVFSKSIFLNSFKKDVGNIHLFRFFQFCPEFVLAQIFYMSGKLHKCEVSRIFYAPRFFEENPKYRYFKYGSPRNYLRKKGQSLYLYPNLADFNLRFEKLVQVVNLENFTVVDLNAGHGNLIKYLPKSAAYLGNDIYPQSDHVLKMKDFDFAITLVKVDCLCIFGWTTGNVEVESKTQNSAINYILDKFEPIYFVAESVIEYQDLFLKIFEEMLINYKVLNRFEFEVLNSRHPTRVMYIWEKLNL